MTDPTSIVALLPSPQSVRPCLDCALGAAEGLDAAISAIHVGFNAQLALTDPEEVDVQSLRARHEGDPQERRAKTRAAFDDWMARNHPPLAVTWRDDEGDVVVRVAEDTAAADLVVMRNPAHMDGHDAFHSVLFRSRRLLLVAPHDPLPTRPVVGRHVVLGWKPGAAAERAARAALPWLRKAARLTVLCVHRPGRDAYRDSASAAFAGLGLSVTPTLVAQSGPSVGRQLLAETARLGGDSLLIGAFHHGALWRAMLGGVTRDVLAEARLPVFMQS